MALLATSSEIISSSPEPKGQFTDRYLLEHIKPNQVTHRAVPPNSV